MVLLYFLQLVFLVSSRLRGAVVFINLLLFFHRLLNICNTVNVVAAPVDIDFFAFVPDQGFLLIHLQHFFQVLLNLRIR